MIVKISENLIRNRKLLILMKKKKFKKKKYLFTDNSIKIPEVNK